MSFCIDNSHTGTESLRALAYASLAGLSHETSSHSACRAAPGHHLAPGALCVLATDAKSIDIFMWKFSHSNYICKFLNLFKFVDSNTHHEFHVFLTKLTNWKAYHTFYKWKKKPLLRDYILGVWDSSGILELLPTCKLGDRVDIRPS